MACRKPILRFEQHCNTEATIGFVATFAQFFSFLTLTSSSRTCSCIQKLSHIFVFTLPSCIDDCRFGAALEASQITSEEQSVKIFTRTPFNEKDRTTANFEFHPLLPNSTSSFCRNPIPIHSMNKMTHDMYVLAASTSSH